MQYSQPKQESCKHPNFSVAALLHVDKLSRHITVSARKKKSNILICELSTCLFNVEHLHFLGRSIQRLISLNRLILCTLI